MLKLSKSKDAFQNCAAYHAPNDEIEPELLTLKVSECVAHIPGDQQLWAVVQNEKVTIWVLPKHY